MLMDSPKDEEFERRNKKLLEEEADIEARYEDMEQNGTPCDTCGDRYLLDQLYTKDEEGITLLVCTYCK